MEFESICFKNLDSWWFLLRWQLATYRIQPEKKTKQKQKQQKNQTENENKIHDAITYQMFQISTPQSKNEVCVNIKYNILLLIKWPISG